MHALLLMAQVALLNLKSKTPWQNRQPGKWAGSKVTWSPSVGGSADLSSVVASAWWYAGRVMK